MIVENFKTNHHIYVESYSDTDYVTLGINNYSGIINREDIKFLYKCFGEILNESDSIDS